MHTEALTCCRFMVEGSFLKQFANQSSNLFARCHIETTPSFTTQCGLHHPVWYRARVTPKSQSDRTALRLKLILHPCHRAELCITNKHEKKMSRMTLRICENTNAKHRNQMRSNAIRIQVKSMASLITFDRICKCSITIVRSCTHHIIHDGDGDALSPKPCLAWKGMLIVSNR